MKDLRKYERYNRVDEMYNRLDGRYNRLDERYNQHKLLESGLKTLKRVIEWLEESRGHERSFIGTEFVTIW
jgi:hypothetical protein